MGVGGRTVSSVGRGTYFSTDPEKRLVNSTLEGKGAWSSDERLDITVQRTVDVRRHTRKESDAPVTPWPMTS